MTLPDERSINPCQGAEPPFSAHQIVVLVRFDLRLYAEVIQVVPVRGNCWVRPLAIAYGPDAAAPEQVQDLRQGPDIICATHYFQPALDTEWIEVWTQLQHAAVVHDWAEANRILRSLLSTIYLHTDPKTEAFSNADTDSAKLPPRPLKP